MSYKKHVIERREESVKKLIGFVCLFLVGCNTETKNVPTNEPFDQIMEEADLALETGEFEKAITSLELALDEKPDDKKAKTLYENLVAFNLVTEAMENGDWEDALMKANNLLKEKSLTSSIKEKVEKYIEESKAQLAKKEQIATESKTTENDEIEKDEKTAKNAEIVKESGDDEKEENANSESKREKYLKKLAEIELSLAEYEQALENGTTVEMKQAQGEIFTRWDNVLNEIYQALEEQLSPSDMDKLREEQRNWIKYRDETAKAAASKYEGGTMESLEYISTQAGLTKERCYELVEGYME